jgi:hypothetical protein
VRQDLILTEECDLLVSAAGDVVAPGACVAGRLHREVTLVQARGAGVHLQHIGRMELQMETSDTGCPIETEIAKLELSVALLLREEGIGF